jgi:hypothetical protein
MSLWSQFSWKQQQYDNSLYLFNKINTKRKIIVLVLWIKILETIRTL